MKIRIKLSSKVITFSITLMLLLSFTNIARAIIYISMPGMLFPDQYNIQIKPKWNNGYNFTADLDNARYAWNGSAARVYFSRTSSPTQVRYITITDYYYGNIGWDGKCYPGQMSSSLTSIQINDTSALDSSQQAYSHKSELIAHELGHALLLWDTSDNTSLMLNSGYKGSPAPSQYDIDCVNSIYK